IERAQSSCANEKKTFPCVRLLSTVTLRDCGPSVRTPRVGSFRAVANRTGSGVGSVFPSNLLTCSRYTSKQARGVPPSIGIPKLLGSERSVPVAADQKVKLVEPGGEQRPFELACLHSFPSDGSADTEHATGQL